ncbi:AraC family transcriptional regulator [Thiocapsa roseopersicina]|uniref:Helix-turn-helix domain-containing protein n=1 Tax=Thiocapsa roseopersicina TaxID=1058 RepID=A0A1H2QWB0_THIRO|nr:AraC family transcriptional regulator [Thiocapsa roseopersicina]SDW11198.1 Helix-turn-helix domain-containing protein [Thiocapsa roseopersicina]
MSQDARTLEAKIPPPEADAPASGNRGRFGDLWVGPILALPAVLTELGVSPGRAFAEAEVDPGLLDNPEARIAIEPLGRLLDICVALTQCNHFGLLLGERFNLQALGHLGALMRHSPTVGDAVRSLLLHLHLTDRGAAPVLLAPDPSCVTLGYSIYRHGTPATAQILDAAIAIGYGMLRELCGPAWQPVRLQFSHARPANIAPYRRVFGATPTFDAEVSAILFASSWLLRPIAGADARLYGVFARAIREATANYPMSFAEQVSGVLHQMIRGGNASADAIARLFGIRERTLRRRLAHEGKHLQQLVDEERFEIAKQLLHDTNLPVADVAAAVQYADPNAFSRAFRSWAGLSPKQWRQDCSNGLARTSPVHD